MSTNTNMWIEPVIVDSDNPPQYPYNNIQQSESGHSIELDDTPGRERVRIQHRSNTFTEMQPNGDRVNKVYGTNYEIIAGDNNVLIKGQCNITINGACVITIIGDADMQVNGNLNQKVSGDVVQAIDGAVNITAKSDVQISSSGDISLSGENVNVNGDFNVFGGITTTQSVSAIGNINAGEQVSAKIGVITTGYMCAGSSIPRNPLPGWVSGIQISDIVRPMSLDRMIYDMHIHGGVKSGPSTTTAPLMSE